MAMIARRLTIRVLVVSSMAPVVLMTSSACETEPILRFFPRDPEGWRLSNKGVSSVGEEAVGCDTKCIDAEGEAMLGVERLGADTALIVCVRVRRLA
jgi:hypothetical protein